MKRTFTEITIHLINGEDIHCSSERINNQESKIINQFLDKDINLMSINYDVHSTAYIAKENILYIDVRHDIFDRDALVKCLEDYANENE